MNILFVGPYKQPDEWGRKSRAMLGALKRTGNTITSRPIYFSSHFWNYNEEAEQSTCEAYDAVIQFVLPSFAVYDGKFKKNIGFFNTETIDTSPFSTALSRMEILDEIWVENKDIYENLKNRVETTKISLIKPHMDTSLTQCIPDVGTYNEFLRRSRQEFQDKFIFYAIGSLSEREGATELICAYISEFSLSDNCVLIYVLEQSADGGEVNKMIDDCGRRVGAIQPEDQRPLIHVMNPQLAYGRISLLPPEARLAAHKDGDCFVCPDYSLNCSSLILESVIAQSTPIINKNTTAYELLGESGAWGVESYKDNCLLNHRSFDDMFTSKETCVKPIVKSLSHSMREAYTNKLLRDKKRLNNIETTQSFESDAYYDSLEELLCSR